MFAFGKTIYDEKFGEENDAKDCTLWRGDNSGVASLWCHPMPRLADGD
jgi:hypothetical protein